MLAYETIREYAEEIIMNHDHEGMEAILYTDGECWVRQSGSWGSDENEIMVKIPLGQTYWGDSYIWGEDIEKDLVLKETATNDLVEEIYFRIADWQDQQTEVKKIETEVKAMEEYFEEERKVYEDMIGL